MTLRYWITALALGCALALNGTETLSYPQAERLDLVDNLHGHEIPDPYRWLEEIDSPQSQEWVEAQSEMANDYLKALPHREEIEARLSELQNYERKGVPDKHFGNYFWFENSGLQNQAVLYHSNEPFAKAGIALDPNTFSEDGTRSLGGYEVSQDGRFVVYGVHDGGSDWVEWRVRDLTTGHDLLDRIEWSKFCQAVWSHDNSGFYYVRYPAPEEGQELATVNEENGVYFHRIGTHQEADTLIFQNEEDAQLAYQPVVTEDGGYLLLIGRRGCNPETQILYKDLLYPDSDFEPLMDEEDAAYHPLGNRGGLFWFLTDLDAPMKRIILVDVDQPDRSAWVEVIPEADCSIKSAAIIGERLVVHYLEHAKSSVKIYDLFGHFLGDLPLPGLGTVGSISGEQYDPELFFSFASFNRPTEVYRYDLEFGGDDLDLLFQPEVAFDPDEYVVQQIFYESKDGTKVPMFICHHSDTELDGNNPTILYGYGGFNIPILPYFSVRTLVWMEQGGVWAVANIRGGSEYGEAWHQAGAKLNKQNVFDDFIAAGEYLVEQEYTSPDHLGILGGSNGGLLVGACMNQRPDLYSCCVPAVGVMDMLRFHKWTIGWAWMSDYGNPDNPEDFATLVQYSPYHNLVEGQEYPATLVLTADHDDRVFPAHSFKYAAQLQHCQAGNAPTLIRIETRAGHGAGKPMSKVVEEQADMLAFFTQHLK